MAEAPTHLLRPQVKDEFAAYFNGSKPAFASTLVGILLRLYGTPVLNWQTETVQLQVKDDLGVDMPRVVYDKLMALMGAITTDAVYSDVGYFDEFISAINGRGFGTDDDMPTVQDVVYALVELQMNDPEPPHRWHSNIKKYVGVVLADEGYMFPPQILSFADGKAIQAEGNTDPTMFSGGWAGKQEMADEMDNVAEARAIDIINQLSDVGINVTADDHERESEAEQP